MTRPIGITMGDPAGIGPEIILKAMQKAGGRGQKAAWRVIGNRAVFEQETGRLGLKVDLDCVDDAVGSPGRFRVGRVRKSCGRAALAALETGVRLLKHGDISALVTGPVSKESLRLAGFRWPGQTEFLAEELGARRHAMLAWTPRFKAVFVTAHQPLAHVSRHVTPDGVLEKTRLLDEFLRRELGRRPRICCLAFNPHASEFSLGEEGWIAEAAALARKQGIDATGPVPADAAVARCSDYDGFVAMYHDQAMIPAKLLGRDSGVNVTLGLPFVRTSPLHGVAFDIAGKGMANPGSMLAAIRLARKLTARPARLTSGGRGLQ